MVSKGLKIATGKGLSTKLLNSYGLNVTENFLQEALIEPISEGTALVVGGKESANFNNLFERSINSGIDGVISALLLSGSTIGLAKSANVVNKLNNNTGVSQTEIKEAIKEIQESGKVNVEEVIQGVTQGVLENEQTTQQNTNTQDIAPYQQIDNNIANNEQTLYNNNESESVINGRENEIIKSNEQGGITGLLSSDNRGQTNDTRYQENLTREEEIKYITDNNNHIKELNENQKNILNRYKDKNVSVVFYSLNSKNGGFYKDGKLYINTYNLNNNELNNVATHEYAHHLIRDDVEFNKKIYPIAEQIVKNETEGQTEAIRNYIMERDTNISLEDIDRIQQVAVEEILADYAIDIDNGVNFIEENQYGVDIELLNQYRDILKDYLPKQLIETLKNENTNKEQNDIAPIVQNNKLEENIAPVVGEIKEQVEEQYPITDLSESKDIEKKTKKQIKQELLEETGILNESLDNARNIPKALMTNTDPIRLQEIIFGKELGTKINNMFFQKTKDNTADKIRFQNKEREEIKALGIKARSKESAAVQKYGEKQYVDEKGETIKYGDKELFDEFPNVETREKIKYAAQVIRQKYDTYIDATNKVLTNLGFNPIPKRTDYMRHFQELNDIFSRFGIPFNYNEQTANDLPTDINGLTANFSPGKNFFASTLHRTGNKTTYDAITGIDGYLEGVGNLIYHTEDIQKCRAFEKYIRDIYGENHGFENLENLSNEEKATRIEKIQNNHMSNYAAWLHEYTNILAGKKAMVDRSIEDIVGRKMYSFLDTAKKQVGNNMVGLNLGSALTNGISGVQALAKTNKIATIKGTADTIKNIFIKDNFIDKSNFLTSRFGSETIAPTVWQKMQNAGFVFMQGTDYLVSNAIVRSKYYEGLAKGLSKSEAMKVADDFGARILGDRSQGGTPNLYNSKVMGLITQFQLEVNNQFYSMFYDTFQEAKQTAKKGNVLKATAGATFTLGQLFAYQYLYNNLYESIVGHRPAFDIISIIATAFGLNDEEDEEETPTDRLKKAADILVDSLPYVNILTGGGRIPVTSGLPNLIGVATGAEDEYGNKLTLGGELEKLIYLLPPTGGGQINKTTQGLSMYDEDLPIAGSYTDSGNLRYTVEEDAWSKIQAGLFGQWSNQNAKEYIESNFKSIDKNNIEELVELGFDSNQYRDYKEGLNEIKQMELKDGESRDVYLFKYIESQDATEQQKSTMIKYLLSDTEVEDLSNLNMSNTAIIDYYEAKANISKKVAKYTNNKNLLTGDTDSENYKEAVDKLSNDKKTEIVNIIKNTNLADKQKAYLYKKFYNSDTIDTMINANISVDDYLTYTTKEFKADYNSNGKAISNSRKNKVISYVNSLKGLNIPQKAILIKSTNTFKFNDYNNDIVKYVKGLDIGYTEKVKILEDLDMTVENDGRVTWKK